ncbi:MAG TPA: 3-dehydroquinate synthase, partial [Candidatus Dormibacteraeota bacterium]|nr:3-dehydroquinate synthase [Candidatus Dormibacteraeota bacterium]
RLVDTDALVEAAAGMNITDVFTAEGEAGFRLRELAALRGALEEGGPVVVACGGGLPVQPAAWELLRGSATVVWLDGPDDLLLERLGAAADRPLLRGDPRERLRDLRRAREAVYAASDLRVDVCGGDVEDVADRVEDAVAGVRLSLEPAGPLEAGSAVGTVRVDLGDRGYDVVVGAGLASLVPEVVPMTARRVCVVADVAVLNVARRVLAELRASGRHGAIVAVRGGERLKTWAKAGRLVNRLAAMRLERGDAVVAVGGGTVGDLAGFAAAAYLRGVAVIHVPTTLLAMVDSAIGGKTGVNLSRGKNLAGAFWQPSAVVCDVDTLRTLPHRARVAALAEVVKYAMILPAPEIVGVLDAEAGLGGLREVEPDVTSRVVLACCALKARVVEGDEREAGARQVLNYGHTAGHALEAATGYTELLHGEAVATGMRVAGRLSVALNGCPPGDVAWQDAVLDRCDLAARPVATDPRRILELTRGDKKARGGAARWVLLDGRGRASVGHAVEDATALAAIEGALGAAR